ncbi:MAG: class I SAM-dependent methyltransferase, partial [Actinomycetota bacterium]|nr:class I SAM-dependent methyltransferase [Actinomycetota bacterium]
RACGQDWSMNPETPIDPLSSAVEHAELGLPLRSAARLSSPKRAVERLTRFLTDRQRAYNRGVVDAIRLLRQRDEQLDHRVDLQADDHERTAAGLRSDLTEVRLAMTETETAAGLTSAQVAELARAVLRLETRMAGLDAALADVRTEQATRRGQDRAQESLVALFLREVRRQLPGTPDPAELRALPDPDEELDRALDEALAGSFDAVQDMRSVYLHDVEPLASKGKVLDVAPGRGEWLELLARAAVPAYGVDANRRTVDECRARGLDVVHAGVLQHLASVPDRSLAAITAFHAAERLGFRNVVELVEQASRVLRPGGVLIVEGPNPENLLVGASGVGVHPAAERALHPDALQFVLAARGFAEVEVRRLHPHPAPLEWSPEFDDLAVKPLEPVVERLNDLLFGPRDVAVLGRRVEG